MAKKKDVKQLEDCQFDVDGTIYGFVAPSVKVNVGNGYEKFTAVELSEDPKKHAAVLVHLVKIGSGVIEVVKKGGK